MVLLTVCNMGSSLDCADTNSGGGLFFSSSNYGTGNNSWDQVWRCLLALCQGLMETHKDSPPPPPVSSGGSPQGAMTVLWSSPCFGDMGARCRL